MKRLIVGIADAKISKSPADELITFSLGSCLGITLYDPVLRIGAMIHSMLPDEAIDSGKNFNPYKYVNSGLPLVLGKLFAMGVAKDNLKIKVAGGAQILDSNSFFNIGARNFEMLREVLREHNLRIHNRDVGDMVNRTVILQMSDGNVKVKRSDKGLISL